eukprot:scaffold321656_cov31-Tisochrysis_lutea.AAC.1
MCGDVLATCDLALVCVVLRRAAARAAARNHLVGRGPGLRVVRRARRQPCMTWSPTATGWAESQESGAWRAP